MYTHQLHRSRHITSRTAGPSPTHAPRYRSCANGVTDILVCRISSCSVVNPLLMTLPGRVLEKQPANGAWKPRECASPQDCGMLDLDQEPLE